MEKLGPPRIHTTSPTLKHHQGLHQIPSKPQQQKMYTLKRATMEMLYIHASLKPISVPKSKFLYYLRCLKKKKNLPKRLGKPTVHTSLIIIWVRASSEVLCLENLLHKSLD